MSFKKFIKQNIFIIAVTAVYACFALLKLGSSSAPQSYYIADGDSMSFTVQFDGTVQLGQVWAYTGVGDQYASPAGRKACGEFELYYSADGENYAHLCNIEDMSVYTWRNIPVSAEASKVQVRAKYPGATLYEVVFCDGEGNVLPASVSDSGAEYGPQNALDEAAAKPEKTDYYGGMYFDEIYHGRTAYEQLHGYDIYETAHPPLGKILISVGVALFGMTPFGWRIVGALCGIVMVPLIWLLVREISHSRYAANAAAVLCACDFMHLTQTRIATVDTYVVLFCLLTFLFMAKYSSQAFGSKKEWLYLALSGFFMGCAASTKWNGTYPMVGLAVFFFVRLYQKYRSSGRSASDKKYIVKTLAFCCAAFVLVPLVIYSLSYLPVIHADSTADYFRQLIIYQHHMYSYHSTLQAEHFFSSMWYTWPFNIKPIWYAIDVTGQTASSISAFGNPAIWALTPFAALYCLYQGIKYKRSGCLLTALGYLFSYLPWVMVSRVCFIYHYFPCAMFGIAAMAMFMGDITAKNPRLKKPVFAYLAVCGILFIMFLPVTTGMAADIYYLDFLEFLPDWHFINL